MDILRITHPMSVIAIRWFKYNKLIILVLNLELSELRQFLIENLHNLGVIWYRRKSFSIAGAKVQTSPSTLHQQVHCLSLNRKDKSTQQFKLIDTSSVLCKLNNTSEILPPLEEVLKPKMKISSQVFSP